MVLVCGRILEMDGRFLLVILDLQLERDLGADFGMILGCSDFALKIVFPSLLRIALDQGASVLDLLNSSSGFSQWNVHFLRALRYWEIESYF